VIRNVRVEKRLDTEVIARAEETLQATVPDCKSEVADEVFDAVFTPPFVGVEDQFVVSWRFLYRKLELLDQLLAPVDAGVCFEPQVFTD
jgi:hypothetical protein